MAVAIFVASPNTRFLGLFRLRSVHLNIFFVSYYIVTEAVLFTFWIKEGLDGATTWRTGKEISKALAPAAAAWDGKSPFKLDATLVPVFLRLLEEGDRSSRSSGRAFLAFLILSLVTACVWRALWALDMRLMASADCYTSCRHLHASTEKKPEDGTSSSIASGFVVTARKTHRKSAAVIVRSFSAQDPTLTSHINCTVI